MATLPTPEEHGRNILAIFAHFNSRAGDALMTNNFVAVAARNNIRTSDLADGLTYAMEQKWVEENSNGSIRLTEAGFAEMPG